MEKVSFGDKVSEELLKFEWWKIASPEDIANIQLFVKEPICPSEVLCGALTEVLGRPIGADDLGDGYDVICNEVLKGGSEPSEKEVEKRLWSIIKKIIATTLRLTFYNLALYPSFIVLALLMVFAAIMGNVSLLGCCTMLIRNYTEDYEDLKERHKESYRKLGYALESLEMAKNYNRLIWSVIL